MDYGFPTLQTRLRRRNSHLSKGNLSKWYRKKQQHVTYLIEEMLSDGQGPIEAYQIRDTRTNLTIPCDLVTMERFDEETDEYELQLATPRVAQLVADIQEIRR